MASRDLTAFLADGEVMPSRWALERVVERFLRRLTELVDSVG